jgi:hypothetical protein
MGVIRINKAVGETLMVIVSRKKKADGGKHKRSGRGIKLLPFFV